MHRRKTLPGLEIGRGEQGVLVPAQEQRHDPLGLRLIPDDLRIAVLGHDVGNDRIPLEVLPGPAAVVAVADVLGTRPVGLHGGVAGSVDSHDHFLGAGLEARGVRIVHHRGSRPDPALLMRLYGVVPLFPVDQVGAYGMAPTTRSPIRSRLMLKEEMILAVVVDQPVGVVEPFLSCREMKLWPVPLVVRVLVLHMDLLFDRFPRCCQPTAPTRPDSSSSRVPRRTARSATGQGTAAALGGFRARPLRLLPAPHRTQPPSLALVA